jgi:hypothetical protein
MSATFSPSGNYGFYIAQQQGASSDPFSSTYYFFMNSAFNYTGGNDPNNPGDSLQHFALFQQNANSYYLGVSDTRACQGSVTSSCTDPAAFDYNDPVVQVQFVPEPMSGALVGAGLILAAGLFRKRTNV